MTVRVAQVIETSANPKEKTNDRIHAYLPANYGATLTTEGLFIVGIDVGGWTMEDYVLPRLASGLIHAKEINT